MHKTVEDVKSIRANFLNNYSLTHWRPCFSLTVVLHPVLFSLRTFQIQWVHRFKIDLDKSIREIRVVKSACPAYTNIHFEGCIYFLKHISPMCR